MTGAVRTLRSIRRGERGLALLLMSTYALTLFGLYLLKPARDSFFLSHQDPTDLPLAFILSAALAVPVSLVYGRASRSWSLARLHVASFALVIVSLLIWRPLLERSGPVASTFFYAWAAVVGGLVTAQFWLLGNALCDAQRAKRLFPLLSLGGIAGAVAGGTVAGQLAEPWGLDALDLVLICAAIWTLVLLLSSLTLRERTLVGAESRHDDRGIRSPSFGGPWRQLRGSRHLLLIVGIVSVSVLVTTFLDYLFKAAAAEAHPGGAALLSYLGTFYARMNMLSFALQLVLTTRLLRGLGVSGSVLVLPVALTLGGVAMLFMPGLTTLATVRASEMSLKYSLDKTSRELLYLPLPLGLKRRFKIFVDTFVERASRGLAGLLLLVMTSVLALSDRILTVALLVLLMSWLALAVSMRRQYIQSFRQAVARRDIDRQGLQPDLQDRGVMAVLEGALGSENPREVAYALAMLRELPAADLPDRVAGLVDHPSPQVRQRALALLVEAGSPVLAGRAAELLADPDPAIGRLAAEYLHRHGGGEALRAAAEGRRAARASVLEYLAGLPAPEKIPAIASVDELRAELGPGSGDAETSRLSLAAAALMGRLWPGSVAGLCGALEDAVPAAEEAAIAALGRRGDRGRLRELAELLGDRRLRHAARRALTAYGPVAVPVLVEAATGADRTARRVALRALARIPYQRTVDLLLEGLPAAPAAVRQAVVPVLLRLRERRSELRFRRRTVDRALRQTVGDLRGLDRVIADLGPGRDEAGDRLLRRCLRETRWRGIERVFQLLALLYDPRDILGAWLRFNHGDRHRRADAMEFLENLLAPQHKLLLAGLRDQPTPVPGRRSAALRALFDHEDVWLRSCAVRALDAELVPGLRAELAAMVADAPPLLAETIALTLDSARRSVTMLTIEKAILLESVDHFDQVDSERLAAIATIARDLSVHEGEVIYAAGDASDAMYLVVDGEVSLRRGAEEIARVGSRETFGAWALFESEPRMFTALAAGECRLLRIDREDFADLMAEDVHVAQSLLKSVARRLRQLASRAA
jgi:ATP/ADP translocase